MTSSLETFWDYREHFRRLFRGEEPAFAEAGEDYLGSAATPPSEKLVQAIWANQLLRTEGLRLADGRPVRVLDPGRWNGSAGPDFRDARLLIGAEETTGDVEVHVRASEWRAHRHEADIDYNRVALHLVLEIDDSAACDRLHNGSTIPRLEIEPYLFPDLETIRRSMSPDDYLYEGPRGLGKCYETMAGAPDEIVIGFLDRAGDERLNGKVRRLAEQAAACGGDLEQVFHQAFLTALGGGAGKTLYYLLAKRAPRCEMDDYARELPPAERGAAFESLLLHVAGLVPPDVEMEEAPDDAKRHADRLRAIWTRFEPYWSDRRIAPTRRWYKGIRPQNFPTRRLAAVAGVLWRSLSSGVEPLADLEGRVRRRLDELRAVRPGKRIPRAVKDIVEWFESSGPDRFWETHYSFAAKPAPRAMALIGESTARSLALNAAAPALALLARERADPELGEAARRLYAAFPPLQPNYITEFMTRRLFGEGGRAKGLLTTERRMQGLFQIFHSCCNGEDKHCDACHYLRER